MSFKFTDHYPNYTWEYVINNCAATHYKDFQEKFPKKEAYIEKYHESVNKLGGGGIIELELNNILKTFSKELRETWKSMAKLLKVRYIEQKFIYQDFAQFIVLAQNDREDLIKAWLQELIATRQAA